jgi:deoxyribodipyrimidine photo-lyase
MIATRRTRFNFALQRAADWARELDLPLVVFEPLRSDYPWASDRLHRFVLDGMAANRDAVDGRKATYYPWIEVERGGGSGLLRSLSDHAAVVVTDEFPTFFLPRMVAAAAQTLSVKLEAVDSNGLVPLAATDRDFPTAHSFRRWLHKNLLPHLERVPLEDPLADRMPKPAGVPGDILDRWPAASNDLLDGAGDALADLPIDHDVPAVDTPGGQLAAGRAMRRFLDDRLVDYDEDRNRPDTDGSSGLSPYLHFGHLSSHEIVLELIRRQGWSPEDVAGPADGRRQGWWQMSEPAEAFLDQVVTWRELGYVFCHHRNDHHRYESLPDWALETLAEHAGDERDPVYELETFDTADTHDRLWNAAQNQLRREGRMHNYLRMLWGKKILEWTASPRAALDVMIELNNRYALDGRDPNSYSGIFWVLGRHDRAWGPERPIFGKVRYMSSDNTARKLPVGDYLDRYAPEEA